jgi:hypothetical protein
MNPVGAAIHFIVEAERREEVFARLEDNLNRAAALDGGLDLTIPLTYLEAEVSG